MVIVGIAGGTGSGKTTVVQKIMELLKAENVGVLHQDAYYKDQGHLSQAERQRLNFDHPDSIEFDLLIDHINNLKHGVAVSVPVYSYHTCTRGEETIPFAPREVVIVEGILVLNHAPLRDLMDIKVFVDAPADDRLVRVIKRDIIERGRDVAKVLERYEHTLKLMHEQFIEPTKRHADIIIPQGGENKVGIKVLSNTIQMNLKKYATGY